jgi:hypothetical protein
VDRVLHLPFDAWELQARMFAMQQTTCKKCKHPRSFHMEDDGSVGRCYAFGCKGCEQFVEKKTKKTAAA